MPQKDYLLRQIEEMGFFLRALIGRLLKKDSGTVEQHVPESIQISLKENLQLEISDLLDPDSDKLLDKLQDTTRYNLENIELLADFIVELSERHFKLKHIDYCNLQENAYRLYEYVDIKGKTFSPDRKEKMNRLKRTTN
jgi:hypothetical protein